MAVLVRQSRSCERSTSITEHPRRGTCHRQRGITLVELLVAMSLVVVIMSIGIPSYRYVTNSNRATTEVNTLLSDLMYARSEAVKEGQDVTVCPSISGTSCVTNSTTWNSGWIVFSDVNGNGSVDTGEQVLHVQSGFSTTTDSLTSDNNVYYVTFNRLGFATGLPSTAAGYITITLHTTPVNPSWTRCIQVAYLGSLQTEHANQGGCL